MILRKRKRARGVVSPNISMAIGYKEGRIEGFQRGRRDGHEQGRSSVKASLERQLAEVPLTVDPTHDVLVISAGHIPSLEIGVLQPLTALKEREGLQFDVKQEGEVTREMLMAARIIVFVRNVEPSAYTLMESAHELGKRTVYVIDDNFLEISPSTAVGHYYSDPARRETFIKFLTHAQIVKVDSQELGSYIENHIQRKAVYFPASVDFNWLDQQPLKERRLEQIVIGYEGGSKEEDFIPVIAALRRILHYYGGFIRLEFYGYAPAALADHPNVHCELGQIEYRSFIQKLKQAQWDIGIAPLRDNTFNANKTNNKFREYAACRIAGIYSQSPVYTPWVSHELTGYLVEHTEEGWFRGIKAMIENPTMRRNIKENAEELSRQQFSLEVCMQSWKSLIL